MGVASFIRTVILPTFTQFLDGLISFPYFGDLFNVWLSWVASTWRLAYGHWAAGNLDNCHRPVKPIVLYQYEGCPFCRRVREACSTLALDVIVYPCPRETLTAYSHVDKSRYRPEAEKIGGKVMFPLMLDPNNGTTGTGSDLRSFYLYESDAIVKYLWSKYGNKAYKPFVCKLADMVPFTLFFPSLFRSVPAMGILRTPSHVPVPCKPLELFSSEGSPYSRIVREALDSLELPYLLRNCPAACGIGGSTAVVTLNRSDYLKRFGHKLSDTRKKAGLISLPLLVDPNTGIEMTESLQIKAYLFKTYASGETTKESWADYSTAGASADHGVISGIVEDNAGNTGKRE